MAEVEKSTNFDIKDNFHHKTSQIQQAANKKMAEKKIKAIRFIFSNNRSNRPVRISFDVKK